MSQRSLKAELSEQRLSQNLYTAQCVREGEVEAAKQMSIPLYDVMLIAGEKLFQWIQKHFDHQTNILVVVGTGNNGGDGYVAASLLLDDGYKVSLASIDPARQLSGDAALAQKSWVASGGEVADIRLLDTEHFELIVDGLLGTGLNGPVSSAYQSVIQRINQSAAHILCIDIPSGLDANTGATLGASINADTTITFVGIKTGLVTANGKQKSANLIFEELNIGETFAHLTEPKARLVEYADFAPLPSRALYSHKGNNGKLLCIGGNNGMAGAIRLTAEAAIRTGAGLVKVYCHPSSASSIVQGRAEIMASSENLLQLLDWADCIVFGPGLGQTTWSQETFNQLLSYLVDQDKPLVIDADGLNLLSQQLHALNLSYLIMSPHSAEAARLLNISIESVENDRYQAASKLVETYGGNCILKGAGSIVHGPLGTYVCANGNPGMSTAGMGDVLSGVLGSLAAQGMTATDASLYGTCIHSAAADLVADNFGQRGMIASDLFDYLRQLVN
ncbi:NAD(P)H-hydrate dehydratase [Aliiglaciecola sp. 2_MG-2023]|uniref:NAD(P)H-hydrate dehydratase n=1 Tax=unclassified Aliiglaciecola TaxID=2593648 RepID=UPI0026E26A89|nr:MULTISPECIES: NAD(P)H-hydrate dehydratase [unclassified Aliiglaciecola]MDO6713334.1 NAD(P)H-hydrate dehydratase [Aliiglaciecola sp. 2_MG-2023]MDO6753670.1 NAD(P)H-hydrate dehydratase [Aliiglaciecola sp. 1_MG-2023]